MATDRPTTSRPLNEAERWFAAEHALGVTEGEARVEAERRVARDASFRAAVEGWHEELRPLLDGIEPVRPPRRLRRAVLARIAPGEGSMGAAALPLGRAIGLILVGATLATALIVATPALRSRLAPLPDSSTLVATLTPAGDSATAVARIDRQRGRIVVHVTLRDEARVPELWLIDGDGPPRSLGLLKDDGTSTALPWVVDVHPSAGQALAISLEPRGGSPTGAPTGPVIASGVFTEL